MRYTHLNNDSYIVYTPQGMRTITRESINFNKIKKSIQEEAPDEVIAELLKPTPLTNGIYKAYLLIDTIYLKHISLHGEVTWQDLKGSPMVTYKEFEPKTTFLGVYTSIDEVIEDWAEYVL